MISRINRSKALISKHISCECERKFDGKNVFQMKIRITINVQQ